MCCRSFDRCEHIRFCGNVKQLFWTCHEFSLKHTSVDASTFYAWSVTTNWRCMPFCRVLTHQFVVTLIMCTMDHKQNVHNWLGRRLFLFDGSYRELSFLHRLLLLLFLLLSIRILYLTASGVSAVAKFVIGTFSKGVHFFDLSWMRSKTHLSRMKTWKEGNVAKTALLIDRRCKFANVFACVSLMSVWPIFFYTAIIDWETPQQRQCEEML